MAQELAVYDSFGVWISPWGFHLVVVPTVLDVFPESTTSLGPLKTLSPEA